MAQKSVNIILKMRDQFSGGFKQFKKSTEMSARETKRLQNSVKAFGRSSAAAFKSFAKGGIMAVGAMGTAVGGLAAKTGFKEALDLEGYRTQLNTATKDTQKAADIMKYAINMANKTPFEGGELVEGAAKFEAMGMSAKKWLELTGDMSAATNKSFDQATEALIDAQTGELERLKEFGITKAMIAEKANKMFTDQEVVNAKGQIVNQEKFNDALVALMKEKYAGGMENMAKTTRGLWSTVTGVAKNGLAKMVGMSEDGTTRAGSALDFFKGKVGELAKRFEQWQTDGTIDRFAQTFDQGFKTAANVASAAFRAFGNTIAFVKNNANWLIPVVAGLVGGIAAFKVINTAIQAFRVFRAVMLMVNVAMLANPIFIIPAAIGVLIGVLTALGLNWKDVFGWIKKHTQGAWDKFQAFVSWIKGIQVPQWLTDLKDKILDGIVTKVGEAWDKFRSFMNWLGNISIPPAVKALGGALSGGMSFAGRLLSGHATGTTYFPGGVTRINEGGRGEIVRLPSGTEIIPHDVSKKSRGGVVVNIPVTIQGNIIGNQEYASYIGNVVTKKVLNAINNM